MFASRNNELVITRLLLIIGLVDQKSPKARQNLPFLKNA